MFQNKNIQPSSTLFNAPPITTFGAFNRFLGAQQPQQQSQQSQPSQVFNPNATMFGEANSSFGTSPSGGFKSFASFGDGKTSGMFGDGKTSGMFGQGNTQAQLLTNTTTFGGQNTMTQQQSNQFQPQSQSSFGQQQSSLFGNQQQQQPQQQPQQQSSMFGQLQQQNTSSFGQSGGTSSFLGGFNPTGMNVPSGAPTSNPSMLKPRKWMIIEQIYVLNYKFSFFIKIKLNKFYRKTIIFINTKKSVWER